MKKHIFITSIGPGKNTLEAIHSWTRIPSVEIHSVNTSTEIKTLKENPVFSTVIFHETPESQTGLQLIGKPYVYFNSIISCGLTFTPNKIILLNSDIILSPNVSVETIENELDKLQTSQYDLIYMHRNDFDENNYNELSYYPYGVDVFVMSQKLLQSFPSTRFMIGQPWIDYFIPHWAIRNNMSVSSWNTRTWLHRRHQSAWVSHGLDDTLRTEFNRFITDRYISQPVSLGDYVQASEIFMPHNIQTTQNRRSRSKSINSHRPSSPSMRKSKSPSKRTWVSRNAGSGRVLGNISIRNPKRSPKHIQTRLLQRKQVSNIRSPVQTRIRTNPFKRRMKSSIKRLTLSNRR
jgi:hypothetical protein